MSDRKAHWEGTYASKAPDEVSWYQQSPDLSLKLIRDTGLQKNESLIDVGGGASTLVDYLVDAGYTAITVLDVSANALDHARQRLGDKASDVEWLEADATAFDSRTGFRLWHDRAVFHFLTDANDRRGYVEALKQSLEPGGHLIMQTFAIGGPRKCSGLNIVQYDAEKIQGELGRGFVLLESGHELHRTPAGGEQKFAWFRLLYTPE